MFQLVPEGRARVSVPSSRLGPWDRGRAMTAHAYTQAYILVTILYRYIIIIIESGDAHAKVHVKLCYVQMLGTYRVTFSLNLTKVYGQDYGYLLGGRDGSFDSSNGNVYGNWFVGRQLTG